MKKKNILLWLLIAVMLAGSAVGCSKNTAEETTGTEATETVAEPETTYSFPQGN